MDKESLENHKKLMDEYLELFNLFAKSCPNMNTDATVSLFRGYLDCYEASFPLDVKHEIVLPDPK